ncbi:MULTISPECIES: molecular chaperone [Pseudomonas]|uniref:fimbrial biogenesis chaperone n=1 Tax=Pseudomonas TaxID=286 RepID=UPI0011A2F2A7|nr:molecular chaperone [Pseudomonas fulva]MBF8692969.1 molecular chaperone [Pseudomonas fulva]MBF8719165.1 molecular chaperone [Pseudomonas fulva]MBF8785422.1 molecular chaperone [Pseudomonas fulva]
MRTLPVGRLRLVAIALAFVLGMTGATLVQASVVVTGTRVIYPGNAKEKTLQLTNQDPFANVVQAWVDIDDPASTPETAKAPFMVNPAVSRVAPGSGQSLRLIYTGAALPQDRESVFYLNVLQIPPRNAAQADRSQMLLILRNRLKLFYRPTGIAGTVEQLPEKLRFSLVESGASWHVLVDNPTGFHASFGAATITVGNRQVKLRAAMVPPYGSVQWTPEATGALTGTAAQLNAQLINDYGARVGITHGLQR